MSLFIIGLFCLVVAATGNAGNLIYYGIDNAWSITRWVGAVYIFRFAYKKAPADVAPAVHLGIWGIVIGLLIIDQKEIRTAIDLAISQLSGTGSAAQNATQEQPMSGTVLGTIIGTPSSGSSSTGSTGTATAPTDAGLTTSQIFWLHQQYPAAAATAKRLNVPVTAVLGQAALETNYGQSAPGNNLFGIKGQGTTQPTTEYVNGQPVSTTANFAAYGSDAGSYSALSNLVQNRYPNAMNTSSALAYGQALQAGGYATDPNYATKLAATANTISGFLP